MKFAAPRKAYYRTWPSASAPERAMGNSVGRNMSVVDPAGIVKSGMQVGSASLFNMISVTVGELAGPSFARL